jgi:hypothetical protein
MKLLQTACAIVSLVFLAVGVYQLWKFGIHSPGLSSFAAAFASGFALSLTCYVFQLSARIFALEKQLQTPR